MDVGHGRRHFLEGKTIVVAGGGLAGSTFAASIQKLWDPSLKPPRIIVYDRDAEEILAQRESYSVSIVGYDQTGGLVVMDKLGLMDHVVDRAVSGLHSSEAFKIWGPDWKVRFSLQRKPLPGLPSGSIRITRKDLRGLLNETVDSWPHSSIEWETKCVSAQRLSDGRLRVQLLRGSSEILEEQDCDLLVAADGASSKLRSWFRPDDKLQYSGAVLRGGVSRFQDGLPSVPGNDWGFIMSHTGVSCFLSPVDQNSLVWALGHMEPDQVSPLDRDDPEAVRRVMERGLELGSRFQEPFRTIVNQTDPKTVMYVNAHDKMPFRHDSIEETPVVFIGDSNHAVTPFAGFGANLALDDGWDLAEQLCNSTSLGTAIAAYDDISVPRAAKVVQGSRKRLKAGHSTGWRYALFWIMLLVSRFIGWLCRKKSGIK